MNGQLNNSTEVLCCFCGNYVSLKDALVLSIYPNIESEESQQLFSHKSHFTERVVKSIPLHPDFF
ncbi:MAG: hypothetical protein RL263_1008 [Bacteroidota bacterium]|jgi:hypothetical protein